VCNVHMYDVPGIDTYVGRTVFSRTLVDVHALYIGIVRERDPTLVNTLSLTCQQGVFRYHHGQAACELPLLVTIIRLER
jgi:hypothetical protein